MKLRKNWFGYIIWILVSALSASFLSVNVIYGTVKLGFLRNDTLIGFVCLFFVGCFGVYEMLSTFIRLLIRKNQLKQNVIRVILGGAFVVCMVIFAIIHFSQISSTKYSLHPSDEIYYYASNAHLVFEEQWSILKQAYIAFLRNSFLLLGTSKMAAMIVQLFLEQLVLLIFYCIVSLLSDRLTALIFYIVVNLLQCFNSGINVLSEEPLQLVILSTIVLLFVIIFQYEERRGTAGIGTEFLYAGIGVLAGAASAFEISGAVVTAAIFLSLLTETKIKNTDDRNRQRYHQMPVHAAYFLVAAAAAFLLVLYLTQGEKDTIFTSLQRYHTIYFGQVNYSTYWIYTQQSSLFNIAMGMLACIWFFVYLVIPYDYIRLSALITFGFFLLQSFHIQSFRYDKAVVLAVVFMNLAGIQGIIYYQKLLSKRDKNYVISYDQNQNSVELQEDSSSEPPATKSGYSMYALAVADGRMEAEKANVLFQNFKTMIRENREEKMFRESSKHVDHIGSYDELYRMQVPSSEENVLLDTESLQLHSLQQKEKKNSEEKLQQESGKNLEEMHQQEAGKNLEEMKQQETGKNLEEMHQQEARKNLEEMHQQEAGKNLEELHQREAGKNLEEMKQQETGKNLEEILQRETEKNSKEELLPKDVEQREEAWQPNEEPFRQEIVFEMYETSLNRNTLQDDGTQSNEQTKEERKPDAELEFVGSNVFARAWKHSRMQKTSVSLWDKMQEEIPALNQQQFDTKASTGFESENHADHKEMVQNEEPYENDFIVPNFNEAEETYNPDLGFGGNELNEISYEKNSDFRKNRELYAVSDTQNSNNSTSVEENRMGQQEEFIPIEEPIKQPVKKPGKRIDYEINVDDEQDYDLLDIPEDDDFDFS